MKTSKRMMKRISALMERASHLKEARKADSALEKEIIKMVKNHPEANWTSFDKRDKNLIQRLLKFALDNHVLTMEEAYQKYTKRGKGAIACG